MSKQLTILLVDDDADWRMVLGDALLCELGDVQIVEASGGHEVMKLLGSSSQFRPDLVCADLDMPGMNGMELLRSIKTSRALRSIPVVIITGQDDLLTRNAAICNGASGFTSKSLDLKKLITKVLYPLICSSWRDES